jgi:hypothetical protein
MQPVAAAQVPPMELSQVRAILERELASLGRSFDDAFAAFEPVPLGSASVAQARQRPRSSGRGSCARSRAAAAQVHKARLRAPGGGAGATVAVKVQNPGAESLMALDLANLRGVAFVLQRTELRFDLLSAVEELGAQVAGEFDFCREARCMDDIAARLACMRGRVAVPRSVRGLVTRRMLCMSFLEGIQARAAAASLPARRGRADTAACAGHAAAGARGVARRGARRGRARAGRGDGGVRAHDLHAGALSSGQSPRQPAGHARRVRGLARLWTVQGAVARAARRAGGAVPGAGARCSGSGAAARRWRRGA